MDLALHPGTALPAEARPAPASGAEALSCAVLGDIAAGLAAAEPLWRAVVRHDPAGRRPVRLLATDRYEAWVIGWKPGQGVDLHDHGPSAGALAVVEGELTELVPRRGRLVPRVLEAG